MKEAEARRLIRSPLITEKGSLLQEANNQYLFRVDRRANKIRIKEAIEQLFHVKVRSVTTMTVHGKMRRTGRTQGRQASWKKAIVTLQEGDTIELA